MGIEEIIRQLKATKAHGIDRRSSDNYQMMSRKFFQILQGMEEKLANLRHLRTLAEELGDRSMAESFNSEMRKVQREMATYEEAWKLSKQVANL